MDFVHPQHDDALFLQYSLFLAETGQVAVSPSWELLRGKPKTRRFGLTTRWWSTPLPTKPFFDYPKVKICGKRFGRLDTSPTFSGGNWTNPLTYTTAWKLGPVCGLSLNILLSTPGFPQTEVLRLSQLRAARRPPRQESHQTPAPFGGGVLWTGACQAGTEFKPKAGAAFRGCMAFGGETTNNRSWKRRFFSPQLINRKGLICRSIRQAARPAFGATRALPSAELRERLSPWKPLGKSGASAHAKGTNPNWKLSQAYGPSSTLGMPKREPFDKPPNCEDG